MRVAAGVLGIKAYTVFVVYVMWTQVDLRAGYEAFLFLADGETRSERLREIQGGFLERLAPYDGQFYLDIAARGYRVFDREDLNTAVGPEGNYAFFPLYPLLVRGARWAGRDGGLGILLALNVVLSGAAAVGLYRLAERLTIPAWPSVLFLLTFPTAVFQSVLYSESLFLFLSVTAACCALTARPWRGAALGWLAGLCRPQGVLVSFLWTDRLFKRGSAALRPPRARLRMLFSAIAPVAGLATFSVLLWSQVGAPFGFLGIQRHWSREFSASNLLAEILSPGSYEGPPFDYLALLLGVGLVPFLWRCLPPSLALYGTLTVVLPLATGTMLSFGRFLSVSFPHFLCLAKLFEGWRVASVTLLGSFIVLQCLVAKGLVGWYFVG